MPVPTLLDADLTPDRAVHHARCGTCLQWLHVTEDELLADRPLTCWSCDTGGASPDRR